MWDGLQSLLVGSVATGLFIGVIFVVNLFRSAYDRDREAAERISHMENLEKSRKEATPFFAISSSETRMVNNPTGLAAQFFFQVKNIQPQPAREIESRVILLRADFKEEPQVSDASSPNDIGLNTPFNMWVPFKFGGSSSPPYFVILLIRYGDALEPEKRPHPQRWYLKWRGAVDGKAWKDLENVTISERDEVLKRLPKSLTDGF